ncbi:LysR substrate-binding domain-containing protein [Malikia spinosa]|jgi:DNA-binding transcriptional LysR family regulator|uniref:LysR substrate-binding domain-containing protein n=1 Tax=Malikia spinosa TaxID=86180 RepID=UPI003227C635
MARLNRLPPIHTLAAFESAARLGGFAQAAAELCITPSAVSHRIRQLETLLGEQLFDRSPTGVRLTPAGQRTLQGVREAFDKLAQLFSTETQGMRLTVGSPPTFARNLLIPRLPEFYQQWPDIDIQLAVAAPMQDKPERHDVDIRFGKPPFDDRLSIKLFDDQLLVLAAPSYLSRRPLSCPTDLVQADLLRSPLVPWQPWMVAAGLEPREPGRGASFTDLGFLLEAAASGLGVAICPGRLAQHWQENGQLVALFDVAVASESTYYALVNRAAAQRPEVEAFLDWLGTTFE